MNKPPLWFTVLVTVALLWNLAGFFAVVADLRLSAAEIAALPQQQQALYAARPVWSIVASVVAVAGGTLGCLGLLVRKRWAHWVLFSSLFGVVVQDIGIFVVAGAASVSGIVPFVLQGVVFVVAVALVMLARRAVARAWLT
jgi:hypothetical protein